jgi:hypothetical protein
MILNDDESTLEIHRQEVASGGRIAGADVRLAFCVSVPDSPAPITSPGSVIRQLAPF